MGGGAGRPKRLFFLFFLVFSMVFWFWGTGDWPGWRRHLGLLGDPGGEREAGWRGLDWPELAWPGGRLVQPVPSPPEPKNL